MHYSSYCGDWIIECRVCWFVFLRFLLRHTSSDLTLPAHCSTKLTATSHRDLCWFSRAIRLLKLQTNKFVLKMLSVTFCTFSKHLWSLHSISTYIELHSISTYIELHFTASQTECVSKLNGNKRWGIIM
jgi:hypothetical protein